MGLNIHARRRRSLKLFDPFGLQSQSVEAVVVAGAINGHDGNVVMTVVGLTKVSSYWLLSLMFCVSTVFQESGFKSTFSFTYILLTTFSATDEIYNIGGVAVE